MNKTDIVFYLSLLSQVGALFAKLTTTLLSATTVAWIVVISSVVAFVAFAFYEKLTGTYTVPVDPR